MAGSMRRKRIAFRGLGLWGLWGARHPHQCPRPCTERPGAQQEYVSATGNAFPLLLPHLTPIVPVLGTPGMAGVSGLVLGARV